MSIPTEHKISYAQHFAAREYDIRSWGDIIKANSGEHLDDCARPGEWSFLQQLFLLAQEVIDET